jgi:hypothetical protein
MYIKVFFVLSPQRLSDSITNAVIRVAMQ